MYVQEPIIFLKFWLHSCSLWLNVSVEFTWYVIFKAKTYLQKRYREKKDIEFIVQTSKWVTKRKLRFRVWTLDILLPCRLLMVHTSWYLTLQVVGKPGPTVKRISGLTVLDNNTVNLVSILLTTAMTSFAFLYIFWMYPASSIWIL